MKLPNLRGRVAYIFEESDFDVDQIIGVSNIRMQDLDELAKIAMTSFDTSFAQNVRVGDLLVGGSNFGYGHPHYPPMSAMRKLGVTGVIAESFSPGYWWGEIAGGFPQISCPGILALAARWDEIEVDWDSKRISNLTDGRSLAFEPLSQSDLMVLEAGGLIPYLKQQSETGSPHVPA